MTAILFPSIGMFPYIMIFSTLLFFDSNVHNRILSITGSGRLDRAVFKWTSSSFSFHISPFLLSLFSSLFRSAVPFAGGCRGAAAAAAYGAGGQRRGPTADWPERGGLGTDPGGVRTPPARDVSGWGWWIPVAVALSWLAGAV